MVLKRGEKLMYTGYTIKFLQGDFERIREQAEKEHLSPIPWIRQKILNILEKTEDDGSDQKDPNTDSGYIENNTHDLRNYRILT